MSIQKMNIVTPYGGKTSTSTCGFQEWNGMLGVIENKTNELVDAANVPSANTQQSSFYVNGVLTTPTDGVIVLPPAATYELEGTLYGSILITETSNQELLTKLILKGVNIITSNTYAIHYAVAQGQNGYGIFDIQVARDTMNYINNTTVVAVADEQPASIYSMHKLNIKGTGYLSIINKGGHGIKASTLNLTGPSIYVDASHDAFHGVNFINIHWGNFYINRAKDGFGTGDTGIIHIFGGNFYAYNIIENIFDGKTACYIFNPNYKIVDTDVNSALQFTHITKVYETPAAYYGELAAGVITESAVDVDGNPTGDITTVVADANGVYNITKQWVKVEGYIKGTISIPSTISDVYLWTNKAYISNSTTLTPTIYYQASSSKLKIYSGANTINYIENTLIGDNTLVDTDAVKSENNISIEVKNDSTLFITSTNADGLDGGDVKVTDSKGTLMCVNCGQRGIKGGCITIGPNVEITSSVVTTWYLDKTDTVNYKEMWGAVISKNNCLKFPVGVGIVPIDSKDVTYKNIGMADIYGRNGKFSKGTFNVKSQCMLGVIICDSIAAKISMEMDKCQGIYYTNLVSAGSVGMSNNSGITFDKYICVSGVKATIPK